LHLQELLSDKVAHLRVPEQLQHLQLLLKHAQLVRALVRQWLIEFLVEVRALHILISPYFHFQSLQYLHLYRILLA
jgi:hypothetical protein